MNLVWKVVEDAPARDNDIRGGGLKRVALLRRNNRQMWHVTCHMSHVTREQSNSARSKPTRNLLSVFKLCKYSTYCIRRNCLLSFFFTFFPIQDVKYLKQITMTTQLTNTYRDEWQQLRMTCKFEMAQGIRNSLLSDGWTWEALALHGYHQSTG